jgi:hypothetical protein
MSKAVRLTGLVIVSGVVFLAVFFSQKSFTDSCQDIPLWEESEETETTIENGPRESITFILGEDGDDPNQYYTEAANYYRFSETGSTEHVITHCRSLLEVKDYLANYPPQNNQPWGTVNMVVHSNEWSDLGVSVVPGGERVSVATITAAIDSGSFVALPNQLMDNQTELIIYGCGLGRNLQMLRAISIAFGSNDIDQQRPIVRSSRYFVFYESMKHSNGKPYNCKRYMADYWYAFYRRHHRPKDSRIARQLQQRYPNSEMDWSDVLTRTQPRYLGDDFHYTFNIPLAWYVTYPTKAERPQLETKEEEKAWLANQPELHEAVKEFGFNMDNFRWTFQNVNYEFEDGTSEPAVKAVGVCTILCVLKPFTQPDPGNPNFQIPIEPLLTDSQFYGIEMPETSANIAMEYK